MRPPISHLGADEAEALNHDVAQGYCADCGHESYGYLCCACGQELLRRSTSGSRMCADCAIKAAKKTPRRSTSDLIRSLEVSW